MSPEVKSEINSLRRDLDRLEKTLKDGQDGDANKFVLFVRYRPVEVLVYGVVALILTAVFSAFIALVIKS